MKRKISNAIIVAVGIIILALVTHALYFPSEPVSEPPVDEQLQRDIDTLKADTARLKARIRQIERSYQTCYAWKNSDPQIFN